MSLIAMVRQLKPASVRWLLRKRYLERIVEDGVRGVKITEAGHRYFAQFPKLNRRSK